MSNITNKIVWQTANTEKSFVYALHPTLNCNMFSFQVQPGYRIGDDGKPTVTRKAECGEVARRLVACWRACAGISTENLEDNLPVMDLAKRYNAAICKIDRLVAQRDQLLKALDRIAKWDQHTTEFALDWGSRGVSDLYRGIARDAIAACQPAPPVVHLPADDTEGGDL